MLIIGHIWLNSSIINSDPTNFFKSGISFIFEVESTKAKFTPFFLGSISILFSVILKNCVLSK